MGLFVVLFLASLGGMDIKTLHRFTLLVLHCIFKGNLNSLTKNRELDLMDEAKMEMSSLLPLKGPKKVRHTVPFRSENND